MSEKAGFGGKEYGKDALEAQRRLSGTYGKNSGHVVPESVELSPEAEAELKRLGGFSDLGGSDRIEDLYAPPEA